ncbi:MAG: amidohydrolase family protein [Dehalococcoidia bacterium]
MLIIDTHCHAGRNWFEPVETLVHVMDMDEVDHALLLQHRGTYDAEYLFQCCERYPGRFRSAVQIDHRLDDQVGALTREAERGAGGVRLYTDDSGAPQQPELWEAAGRLGVGVSSQGTFKGFLTEAYRDLIASVPDTQVVIEHFGNAGHGHKPPYEEFRRLLKLADLPNATMKLHGFGEIGERPEVLAPEYKIENVPPFVEMAVEAFGPRRLMWGSDFPPSAGREGYHNALDAIRSHPALSAGEDAEEVMGRTAARVFGFEIV